MSRIMKQEEKIRGSNDDVEGYNSYISKRRTRTTQEIKYSCGCKYLFNHETVLDHVCSEHERELITLHG